MKDELKITRREFIKSTGAIVTVASIGVGGAWGLDSSKPRKNVIMEKRELGKTGEKLSIIGFGGIIVCGTEQSEANRVVREAIDMGINYFDVAPTYCDTEAETKLGIALEGIRKNIFLACKTEKRRKEEAKEALEQSLKRLKTDYFDLYQLHAMTTKEDLETAMGPDGAIEAFLEAKEKGLIRFIGFSAHSAQIAVQLMDMFPFDSVLFPINWVCYHNGNFGPQVLERAKEKGIGRLALKAMAKRPWEKDEPRDYPKCWYKPVTDPEETDLAVRFTLSQELTAAVTPGDIRLFDRAVEVVSKGFKPLTNEEHELVKQKAQGVEPIFKA